MKKTLLSLAAMLLLAGGASAQTAKSAAVYTDKVDATPVSVVKKAKAPMMKEEESKYVTIGFEGSANPATVWGPYNWTSASMILSAQNNGDNFDFSELAGYKIVGLNFAVVGSLGEEAGILGLIFPDEKSEPVQLGAMVEEGSYDICDFNQQTGELGLVWNSLLFANQYEITGKEAAFYYGFGYTPTGGNGKSLDDTPFLLGKSSDKGVDGMCLVYGKPSASDNEGMWTLNKKTATEGMCPCMQLILEKPDGATVILGLNGSDKPVAMQYFSLDGKQLSAPQKGINVVKMSDGTSKKVLVK